MTKTKGRGGGLLWWIFVMPIKVAWLLFMLPFLPFIALIKLFGRGKMPKVIVHRRKDGGTWSERSDQRGKSTVPGRGGRPSRRRR